MTAYTFTRDLDGAPNGSTVNLTADEAEPLLRSGAIVKADGASKPAAETKADRPAETPASDTPTPSVTARRKKG